jgi:GNAT superfamily N-acetyltransferase
MPPALPLPVVEILDKSRHDRANFSCGVPALDAYLQRQAAQDVEKRAAVVYTAVFEPPAIAGYYTLSQFSVEFIKLPETTTKRLARYPFVSASLIGRLAVASAFQGQGLGTDLLFDALWRCLQQSRYIASAGVAVDAKDEIAAAFYRKHGFYSILGAERRLFIPMKTVEQIL